MEHTSPAAAPFDQRYRRWSLLSRFALAVMETSLAALWYRALLQAPGVVWFEILGVLLALLLGSQALAILSGRLNWPLWVRQVLFLTWLFVATLESLKLLLFAQTSISLLEMLRLPVDFFTNAKTNYASFIHVAFALALIGRGAGLARGPLTSLAVSISFQIGLILMLLYGLIFAPRYPGEAATGLYLYLLSGLITLSATRIVSLTEIRGGHMPRFRGIWLASIFGSALIVVAISLLFGQLASTRLVTWFIQALAFIFSLLAALLTILFTPVAHLFWQVLPGVMQAIKSLFSIFTGFQFPKFLEQIVLDLNSVIQQIVPAMIAGRRLFMAALVVLIVVAILVGLRMLRLIRPGEQDEETGATERTSLKKLLRRLRFGQAGNQRNRRYSPGQILAAARIRQIYSRMMTLSQRLGLARPPAATPLEFLPQLQALYTQEPDSVQAITQAYVKVRYGEYPESNAEVDAVTAAWERVRKHGRALARRKPVK